MWKNIFTEGVFVIQLPSNAGISVLMNCVRYEKLLFHELNNIPTLFYQAGPSLYRRSNIKVLITSVSYT